MTPMLMKRHFTSAALSLAATTATFTTSACCAPNPYNRVQWEKPHFSFVAIPANATDESPWDLVSIDVRNDVSWIVARHPAADSGLEIGVGAEEAMSSIRAYEDPALSPYAHIVLDGRPIPLSTDDRVLAGCGFRNFPGYYEGDIYLVCAPLISPDFDRGAELSELIVEANEIEILLTGPAARHFGPQYRFEKVR